MTARDRKKNLIESIATRNEKILEINTELSIYPAKDDPCIQNPTMEKTAYPESRYNVTDQDIINLRKQEQETANQSKGRDDGMGFGTGQAAPKPQVPVPETPQSPMTKTEQKKNSINDPNSILEESEDQEEQSKPGKTFIEVKELEIKQKILHYEKKTILSVIYFEI